MFVVVSKCQYFCSFLNIIFIFCVTAVLKCCDLSIVCFLSRVPGIAPHPSPATRLSSVFLPALNACQQNSHCHAATLCLFPRLLLPVLLSFYQTNKWRVGNWVKILMTAEKVNCRKFSTLSAAKMFQLQRTEKSNSGVLNKRRTRAWEESKSRMAAGPEESGPTL